MQRSRLLAALVVLAASLYLASVGLWGGAILTGLGVLSAVAWWGTSAAGLLAPDKEKRL